MAEVGVELVVAVGDSAEVLELGKEALGKVAFTVEPLAEAGFPALIAFGPDVGRGFFLLDKLASYWVAAARSRATRSRLGRIGSCRWGLMPYYLLEVAST